MANLVGQYDSSNGRIQGKDGFKLLGDVWFINDVYNPILCIYVLHVGGLLLGLSVIAFNIPARERIRLIGGTHLPIICPM